MYRSQTVTTLKLEIITDRKNLDYSSYKTPDFYVEGGRTFFGHQDQVFLSSGFRD